MSRAEFRFPLIGQQVDKLLGYATTAPFGKGNETVVDPYYRKAMEINVCLPVHLADCGTILMIQPDRFTLGPDPIFDTEGILDQIAATLHMKCKLRAEMAKLNVYTKGGLFRKHCESVNFMFVGLVLRLIVPLDHLSISVPSSLGYLGLTMVET